MQYPVRLFFKKGGPSKYMSHLDLTRCMTRCVRRAGIPIWYTEGFNPHPYMTFALPLSLGTTGLYEVMDIKLTEEIAYDEVMSRLNGCLPEGIEVWKIADPRLKPTAIASARYEITLEVEDLSDEELRQRLDKFFARKEIFAEKKTKSKSLIEFDVKPSIKEYRVDDDCRIHLRLPAGCTENINPNVVINSFSLLEKVSIIHSDIVRTEVYTQDMELFS